MCGVAIKFGRFVSLFPVAGSISKTSSAALDVFEVEPATENKLVNLPNFIATPHIGAQTKEAQSLAANVIAEKIIQILRGVI